jgi:hypothetical protein
MSTKPIPAPPLTILPEEPPVPPLAILPEDRDDPGEISAGPPAPPDQEGSFVPLAPTDLGEIVDEPPAPPPAPAAPPVNEAPVGWTVQRFSSYTIAGSAELSFLLALDANSARPLLEAAAARERDLRLEVAEALDATPEHGAYRTAAKHLAELEGERERLVQALDTLDAETPSAGTERLRELARQETEARSTLGTVQRAIAFAQRERDARAIDLHRVACALAERLKAQALDAALHAERTAAGLLAAASANLDSLVTSSAVGAWLKAPLWGDLVGSKATEALLGGPIPPVPPAPPDPRPVLQPFVGMRSVG